MPTVSIFTEKFLPLAQAEARTLGMPAAPMMAIPHPMETMAQAEIASAVDRVLDGIVRALTAREAAGA